MKKRNIMIYVVLIFSLIILDYINLPSFLGLEMSNINGGFHMGILNIIVIITLYSITYKRLDERTIEREKNKNEISILLIRECYQECIEYVEFLNQKTVEEYITSKIDLDILHNKNTSIVNLENSPFLNEHIIVDLVKDGQMTKSQVEGYFRIKKKYKKYINMKITFFDDSRLYESLEMELRRTINSEIEKINTQT